MNPTPTEPPLGYSGPVAIAMPVQVGDTWVFQSEGGKRYTVQVRAVETTEHGPEITMDAPPWVAAECVGCLFTYDVAGTVIRVTNASGIALIKDQWLVKWRVVDLPLYAGKISEFKAGWLISHIVHRKLHLDIMKNQIRVVGYEKVTVPAGQFDAFKVEWSWTDETHPWSGKGYYWYVGELQTIIKSELGWIENFVLVEYRQARNP